MFGVKGAWCKNCFPVKHHCYISYNTQQNNYHLAWIPVPWYYKDSTSSHTILTCRERERERHVLFIDRSMVEFWEKVVLFDQTTLHDSWFALKNFRIQVTGSSNPDHHGLSWRDQGCLFCQWFREAHIHHRPLGHKGLELRRFTRYTEDRAWMACE